MTAIRFEAKPYQIGSWTVLRLPKAVSLKLPSRGQVMVRGTINDVSFHTALEPDGDGGHWLNVDKNMQKSAKTSMGATAILAVESTREWPEPDIPADLRSAVDADPQTRALWRDITPMARWEWIRWVSATSNLETRNRRVGVACSKLKAGSRRPCCFNRNMCCVPEVSKSGVLLGPI